MKLQILRERPQRSWTSKIENFPALFKERLPNVPSAGRLNYFLKNWKILTKDKEILSFVVGFQVPLIQEPCQENVLAMPHIS